MRTVKNIRMYLFHISSILLICSHLYSEDVHPPADADDPGYYEAVSYDKDRDGNGDNKYAKLDIWVPEFSANAPLIVFFHGGGFYKGSRSTVKSNFDIDYLRSKGIAVATCGYPLTKSFWSSDKEDKVNSTDDIYPYTDDAIDYLKTYSSYFGINPSQIFVSGSSAGAVIALRLAYFADHGIHSCAAFNIPTGFDDFADNYNKTPPQPSTIFIHNKYTDDWLHPIGISRTVHSMAKDLNINSRLYGTGDNGLKSIPKGYNKSEYYYRLLKKYGHIDQ
ncbi:MAG: carboxylesterase family protein [Planctomycetes bacterium]|nr:carboxylesterase family protein [Planctomycetota bacterium]